MIIFFAGDCFGEIRKLYDGITFLETELGTQADWVIQVGNLGVWPDPSRADRATKRSGKGRDFAELYLKEIAAPRPTLFISGKHDDHRWMNDRKIRGAMQFCPNLTWLVNGYSTVIGTTDTQVKVLGLGKVYSPTSYANGEGCPIHKRLSHYTRTEVERACSAGPVDIFVSQEAPYGMKIGQYQSEAQGIAKILYATRPRLLIHGHYNYSKEYDYFAKDVVVPTCSLARGELTAYEYLNGMFNRII